MLCIWCSCVCGCVGVRRSQRQGPATDERSYGFFKSSTGAKKKKKRIMMSGTGTLGSDLNCQFASRRLPGTEPGDSEALDPLGLHSLHPVLISHKRRCGSRRTLAGRQLSSLAACLQLGSTERRCAFRRKSAVPTVFVPRYTPQPGLAALVASRCSFSSLLAQYLGRF